VTGRADIGQGNRKGQVLDLVLGEEVHLALGGLGQFYSIARVGRESLGADGCGEHEPKDLTRRTNRPGGCAGRLHVGEKRFHRWLIDANHLPSPKGRHQVSPEDGLVADPGLGLQVHGRAQPRRRPMVERAPALAGINPASSSAVDLLAREPSVSIGLSAEHGSVAIAIKPAEAATPPARRKTVDGTGYSTASHSWNLPNAR
jgi:hypothetical protein